MVTRYGPSPTGSVHLGNLFSAFCDMIYARQTNGSFYLRIEDTDQKRMVEGGIENIVISFKRILIFYLLKDIHLVENMDHIDKVKEQKSIKLM